MNTLPNDVARCMGVFGLNDWQPGCETCLRRTSNRPDPTLWILAESHQDKQCEHLIEPTKRTKSRLNPRVKIKGT